MLVYDTSYGQDDIIDIEIKHCKEHQDNTRILELLEQNRQLKAKCKRLDKYDEVVNENDILLDALEDMVKELENVYMNCDGSLAYHKANKVIARVKGWTSC